MKNPLITVPEEIRKAINSEIRSFLKEGKSVADSRMAKTRRMSDAIRIFVDWTTECKTDDIADLFQRFCEANEGKSYVVEPPRMN